MKIKKMETMKKNGFTLVEVVLSIILFGLVGVLLSQVIITGATFYESFTSKQEIHDQMFLAQRRFNTDVANIRDAQNIFYADSTRLLFKDVDLNSIQYRYTGGTLYRSLNNDGEFPIAENLTDDTRFYYYRLAESYINQNPVIDLTSIWTIRLSLSAVKGTESMTMYTMKAPQNFKYGLVE